VNPAGSKRRWLNLFTRSRSGTPYWSAMLTAVKEPSSTRANRVQKAGRGSPCLCLTPAAYGQKGLKIINATMATSDAVPTTIMITARRNGTSRRASASQALDPVSFSRSRTTW